MKCEVGVWSLHNSEELLPVTESISFHDIIFFHDFCSTQHTCRYSFTFTIVNSKISGWPELTWKVRLLSLYAVLKKYWSWFLLCNDLILLNPWKAMPHDDLLIRKNLSIKHTIQSLQNPAFSFPFFTPHPFHIRTVQNVLHNGCMPSLPIPRLLMSPAFSKLEFAISVRLQFTFWAQLHAKCFSAWPVPGHASIPATNACISESRPWDDGRLSGAII